VVLDSGLDAARRPGLTFERVDSELRTMSA
jgi:hypothetical protein